MKVWIVIEGDTGSDETSVIGVYDKASKADDNVALEERYRPRWAEEWNVQ